MQSYEVVKVGIMTSFQGDHDKLGAAILHLAAPPDPNMAAILVHATSVELQLPQIAIRQSDLPASPSSLRLMDRRECRQVAHTQDPSGILPTVPQAVQE